MCGINVAALPARRKVDCAPSHGAPDHSSTPPVWMHVSWRVANATLRFLETFAYPLSRFSLGHYRRVLAMALTIGDSKLEEPI